MRVALALIVLGLAVAAGAFFTGHPGQVEIVWQGWQIDTSVGVLAAAALVLALIVALLVQLVAALRRVPRNMRRRRAERRRRAGERALTRGLVALAAGEVVQAHREAERAAALLGHAPLALLLLAETAQRRGDVPEARRNYELLRERPDAELLGIRGLLAEALRDGDDVRARALAERAHQLRRNSSWASECLLALQVRAGDWEGAQKTLSAAAPRQAYAPEQLRHQQGVVFYELSRKAEVRGDTKQAIALAARAAALTPDVAATACHHARMLLASGRRRAAARVVEAAWARAPHPELARLYVDMYPSTGAPARTAALQQLAARNPDAGESHLAIAEAALDARLWGEARRHLTAALSTAEPGPSRRLCLLMARLEENDGSNGKAAREWLDRALGAPPEPCYICSRCEAQHADWSSSCGACGGFDTLVWRRPAAAHSGSRALSEPAIAEPLMLPAPEMPAKRSARADQLGGGGAIG